MHFEQFRASLKQLLGFFMTLPLFLILASLWLPIEGQGRPHGDGGYMTTLDFGLLRFGEATWLSSPIGASYKFSTTGFLPLLLTVGATSLLVWLCRVISRWCSRA